MDATHTLLLAQHAGDGASLVNTAGAMYTVAGLTVLLLLLIIFAGFVAYDIFAELYNKYKEKHDEDKT